MRTEMNKDINRDLGIDIIKTLAISFVIGVHFFLNTRYYTTNLDNTNLFFQTYIQQIFLSCIPLFLMATGYLNNNTKITFNYFKKIIPIIIIYFIYSIPALIYRCSINEIPFDIKLWIEQIFSFKGHRYSWYINLYFGLFLLIPFFNKLYISLNNKNINNTFIKKTIINISSSTLDIYLASFLTDRLLYKPFKALSLSQETMFIFLPIMILASLFFAYIIARFRIKYIKVEKIDLFKKHNIKETEKQVA